MDYLNALETAEILIENQTKKSITISVRDCSINGYMVSGYLSADVAPGKKRIDSISFSSLYLDSFISEIADIELAFDISESETWNSLYTSGPISIKTSLFDSHDYSRPEPENVIYDRSQIFIGLRGKTLSSAITEKGIEFYIENNGNYSIYVRPKDISVNGFTIDSSFHALIAPSKCTIDKIPLSQSELREIGITDIEEIELSFEIYDPFTYEIIRTTNPYNIKIDENDVMILEITPKMSNQEYKYYTISELYGDTDDMIIASNGGKEELINQAIITTGEIISIHDEYVVLQNHNERIRNSHQRIYCKIDDYDLYRKLFDPFKNDAFYELCCLTVKGTISDINYMQCGYVIDVEDALFSGMEISSWVGMSDTDLHRTDLDFLLYEQNPKSQKMLFEFDEIFIISSPLSFLDCSCVWYENNTCCLTWGMGTPDEFASLDQILDYCVAVYSNYAKRYGYHDVGDSPYDKMMSVRNNIYNYYYQYGRINLEWNKNNFSISLLYNPSSSLIISFRNDIGTDKLIQIINSLSGDE